MSVMMKPSGVQWIGDIPEHWIKDKLYRLTDFVSSGGTPTSTNHDYYQDGDIVWIQTGDLNDGYVSETSKKITQYGLENSSAKIFDRGTLLMAMYGATIGKLGIMSVDAATNQACCAMKYDTKTNTKFMYYIFLAMRTHLINQSYGGGQPNISQEVVKQQYLCFPKYSEQESIANFLDKATSQIDNAIKTKQTQLETLETLKKSIIHKAVTKGLDPSVAMKDSGVEWIGEIPEHWKIQMFKRTASIKGRIGWQGLTSDEYRTEGKHLLVTGTDFKGRYINWDTCHFVDKERYDEDTKIQLLEKDVLVTKDGTIGKISMAVDMPFPTTLNSGVFVTRPIKNDYIQEYMYWILSSDMLMEFIEYSKVGSTIAHLYQKTFERFIYPLAPLEEQQPIVDFLDREVEKINTLKTNVKNQINKLKEYKKSLIYEYVTGKKQVKE